MKSTTAIKRICLLTAFSCLSLAHADSSKFPAFPTTESYDSLACEGSEGGVIAVTDLNESGPVSLWEATEQRR